MKSLRTVCILSFGLALAACQHEETHPAQAGSPEKIKQGKDLPDSHYLALLESRGFNLKGVGIHPDGYVVEGDIFIPKSDLDASAVLPKAAQRQTGAVSPAKANKIRIQIQPSLADWGHHVLQAVNNWNMAQSNLVLNLVTSGGDIILAPDTDPVLPASHRNLAPETCGLSGLPSNGNPYPFVSLNIDNPLLDLGFTMTLVLTHELGHALGFAHTDGGEGSLIAGTPVTDGASVMNGNNACDDIPRNLSDWDRKATLIKYPKDTPLPGMRMKEGDLRDDLVVFRPSTGKWWVKRSSTNFTGSNEHTWGALGDVAVPRMDTDGDGFADLVYWRPSTGNWHIRASSSNYTNSRTYQWGAVGDIPLGGMDIDFDGKSDLVVYRWWGGIQTTFYVRKSSTNYAETQEYYLGWVGHIPVPDTDLDKDGRDDIVAWCPLDGTWQFLKSSTGYQTQGTLFQWGTLGDVPVSGTDYDGDGKDEMIVFRPSDGTLYMKRSSSDYTTELNKSAGSIGDAPAPDMDFNGDGYKDLGVWTRDSGTWKFRLGPAPEFSRYLSFQWGT